MANLFGDGAPIIYLADLYNFTLPVIDRNKKVERFEEITKIRTDFNDKITKKKRGWRLYCNYTFPTLTETEREDLLLLVNEPGQIWIKFPSLPRKYPVYVEDFEPGKRNGYDDKDSAKLILRGTHKIDRYPSLDQMYTCIRMTGGNII